MNNPPYIPVDEMGSVVAAIATKLGYEINYQYGYVSNLNETLIQMSKTQSFERLKFPLFWFCQPFTIVRGELGSYGSIENARMFIIQQTNRNRKPTDRVENISKPVIWPIYYEWLVQMKKSPAFSIPPDGSFAHSITDRPYWGAGQQNAITDIVDAMEISNALIKISNNKNC